MASEQRNIILLGDSRDYIPKITTPINAVVTDPPYGMNFASKFAETTAGKRFVKGIEGDQTVEEAINTFHAIMGPIMYKLHAEAEIYVFTAWSVVEWWIPAVKDLTFLNESGKPENAWYFDNKGQQRPVNPNGIDHGLRYKMMLIWDKQCGPGMGDTDASWGSGYEVCLYLKRGRRPMPERNGAILKSPRVPPGKNIHPTQKPVALIKQLLKVSTSPGDLVVDPYSGSGSTSVAAKQMGRNSLAFEIDPDYYERSKILLSQENLFTDD
jgi:DNA modification methylase